MKADDPINQRVLEFMNKIFESQNIGPTELSVQLGGKPITPQYVSNIKTGYRTAGKRFIFKLIAKYPEAQSFIFGPDVPKQSELTRNYLMLRESKNQKDIPLIHERAHAGFSDMWSDREWIEKLPTVVMDKRNDGEYMAFEVVGDSMELRGHDDSIRERDILIGKEIESDLWQYKLRIPDILIIALKRDGIIVKQVIKHDVGKGVITCHSFNSYYTDIDIKLEDVVKMYSYKEMRRRR